MFNQGPEIGRINPSFTAGEQDPPQKPMGQPVPPPYQQQPNAGYYGPGYYPNTSGYPSQPYGVPGGPQGLHVQQPYPGMPAYPQYPQRPYVGHTGVTVQPTVFVTSMPAAIHIPDYLCYSIFTMLFCCFPLGIAAIVTSVSTRDNNMAGRQDSAMRSSRTALVLNNVALGVGLTIYTLTTIFVLYAYGLFE